MHIRSWLAVGMVTVLSACGGGDKNTTTESSNSTNTPNTPSDPPTSSNAPAAPASTVLEAKFYQDSDGNAVPDFMETELGYTPTKDDCPLVDSCGNGAAGSELNKKTYTLLMLDASGSMAARMGGITRMEAAKQALQRYVSGVPSFFQLGFLVYGHKGNNTQAGKASSCAEGGAELLMPIGQVQPATFAQQVLTRFQPTGWTPIARALDLARTAFTDKSGPNHIIMVSDGLETCGGDPVAVARQLQTEGYRVVVDVVGFGAGRSDVAQLQSIAQAGGGTYYDAKTRADLDAYFARQLAAFKKTGVDIQCMRNVYLKRVECMSAFNSKVLARYNDEMSKLNPSQQAQAFNELTQLKLKANDAYTKQIEANNAFKAKIDALEAQMQGIVNQTQRASQ